VKNNFESVRGLTMHYVKMLRKATKIVSEYSRPSKRNSKEHAGNRNPAFSATPSCMLRLLQNFREVNCWWRNS